MIELLVPAEATRRFCCRVIEYPSQGCFGARSADRCDPGASRLSIGGDAYCVSTLSRHRASKVSESFSARACESNGLPGFSVTTRVISPLEAGSADVTVGHS